VNPATTSIPISDVWLWPVGFLALSGILFALLLRWAGIRRPGTLAGLAAGILCGATVLGKVHSEWYTRFFVGGETERIALNDLQGRQTADLLAMGRAGVSKAAIDELQETHQKEFDAATKSYESAVRDHARGVRSIAMGCAGLLLGWLAPISFGGLRRRFGSGAEGEGENRGRGTRCLRWSDAAFVALWMQVLVAGFVGAAVLFVFGGSQREALAVAIAFSITSAGLKVTGDRQTGGSNRGDDDPEADVEEAVSCPGRIELIGWLVGAGVLVFAVVGALSFGDEGIVEPTTVFLGTVTLGIGLVLRWLSRSMGGRGSLSIRLISGTLMCAGVPFITAVLCLKVDILNPSILWPVMLGMLIGGDGRWFGAALGLRITGRPWSRALWSALPLADAGAVQVGTAFIFLTAGWIESLSFAAAIVAGAVLCDLTVEKRGKLVRQLYDAIRMDENRGTDDTDK